MQTPQPPQPKKLPKELVAHDQKRVDPYYWLNERDNPDVISYLKAENAYTEATMANTKGLREKLFKEMKGRIKETDISVPYRKRGFYYYSRFETGKDYAIHGRKAASPAGPVGPEELLLDENRVAAGHEFLDIEGYAVSDDNRYLMYAEDLVGRRQYTIRIKDLKTGKLLGDAIPNTSGSQAWAADNKHIFYVVKDPQTLRSYRVYRHKLGTPAQDDVLVYEEKDEAFNLGLSRSRSERFLFIQAESTLTSECLYLDASKPLDKFKVAQPRERDHLYYIDHLGNDFYYVTNWEAKNFRLMKVPIDKPGKANWTEVIPHQKDVLLSGTELFKNYLVLQEKRGGIDTLRVLPWNDFRSAHMIAFEDQAYSATIHHNPEIDTEVLRFAFTSLTTPNSVYDYNMRDRKRTLLKRQEVLGGYDPSRYVSERLWATARDGVKVPISLVYKKGLEKNGKNPLLLYGYGSYGYAIPPYFSSSRVSLLDRGVVFAIAHIRGGDDLGRTWYEDGKLLKKKNSFTDFIDCAEHLIEQKYTQPEKLFAMGGSAGGLLMGAVINMRPDLFKGVVAQVPFVDVMTTMLDPTIPLTTIEYDEWGNPNDRKFYDYILSYSPYDNIEKKDYPALLVTTGFHDSQVQYWEPAKWVARLREMKTDSNPVLLKTDMDSGHGGKSGRFKELEDVAWEYAFILDQAGIRE